MSIKKTLPTSAVGFGLVVGIASGGEITIATVNNADMITMQELAPAWEEATGNTINWVVLEETCCVSGRQQTSRQVAARST